MRWILINYMFNSHLLMLNQLEMMFLLVIVGNVLFSFLQKDVQTSCPDTPFEAQVSWLKPAREIAHSLELY